MSEFNLSEKRKNIIRNNSFGKPTYCIGWNDAIKRCNGQDKEFIRRLKGSFFDLFDKWEIDSDVQLDEIERIDKLAGDKLT